MNEAAIPHVTGSSLPSEHWATPSHLSLSIRHVPFGQRTFRSPQCPGTQSHTLVLVLAKMHASTNKNAACKNGHKSSPQPSSSEWSPQSLTPLHRSLSRMQMLFLHVQSPKRQPTYWLQFSSSDPSGHWAWPSHTADRITHNVPSKHSKPSGGQAAKYFNINLIY